MSPFTVLPAALIALVMAAFLGLRAFRVPGALALPLVGAGFLAFVLVCRNAAPGAADLLDVRLVAAVGVVLALTVQLIGEVVASER